jgi:predicted Fe-Mo cluster-binding NifX family protein
MKIAIPVFQTKISPRFDSTQGFILLHIEKSSVLQRDKLVTESWPVAAKLKQLVDLEVDTVICGGIDVKSMQHLNSNGIRVYSWITGEVDDAIACFLKRGLESGTILGNNGRRKERWQFCAMRNHFCHRIQPGFNPARGEVKNMPKRDGTGPQQKGSGAGKGRGCKRAGKSAGGSGRGKGRGTGQGRGKGTGNGQAGSN